MIKKKNLLKLFADERRMIAYHPEWRSLTGSVTATILLQQINYLWDTHKQKPFYKFKTACGHTLYKEGDSWTEELGFSLKEFDSAIRKIGQKVSHLRRKKNPEIDHHAKPVEYWTDEQHVTWYQIHETNFLNLLSTIYDIAEQHSHSADHPERSSLPKEHFPKCQNSIQENAEREDRKMPKGDLDLHAKTAFRKMPKGDLDLAGLTQEPFLR